MLGCNNQKKPNVILITIDCLRADYLTCLSSLKNLTPNIDKLAKMGVLFSQAISNGPCTVFSFPSIFTSHYALSYPMKRKFGGLPQPYLSSERNTLTDLLKSKKYFTAAFVQPSPLFNYHNYDRSFDKFDFLEPFEGGLSRSIFETRRIITKLLKNRGSLLDILEKAYSCEKRISRQLGLVRGKVPYRRASRINLKAFNWLNNLDRSSNNFFLWMHYMDPHQPYFPIKMNLLKRISMVHLNEKVYSSAMKARPTKRSEDLSEDELKGIISLYKQEVKYVDSELGSFLAALKQIGVDLENSYIILMADHGEEFMEHGELEHHRKLYDELIHVPLVICGPGIKGNKVIQDQVSLIDVTPTILDLLGYPPLESSQGRSLLPLIKGQKIPSRAVISEYYFIEGIMGFSYRTGEYKYILMLERGKRYSELFSLLKDPEEKYNIVEENEELVGELDAKVAHHMSMEQRMRDAIERKQYLKERIRSLKKILKPST